MEKHAFNKCSLNDCMCQLNFSVRPTESLQESNVQSVGGVVDIFLQISA